MIFQGRTPRQLCDQLEDPTQTRGLGLALLIDHVAHDELVAWRWSPGLGRTPDLTRAPMWSLRCGPGPTPARPARSNGRSIAAANVAHGPPLGYLQA
jgi:hypothetical protein